MRTCSGSATIGRADRRRTATRIAWIDISPSPSAMAARPRPGPCAAVEAAMTTAATASPALRQQLLFLWLTLPNPDSETVAWSLFDGAGDGRRQAGDEERPPYASVLA